MVNYIHLDLYPLRTFNILYAVLTVSLHLRSLYGFSAFRHLYGTELVRKEDALYLRFFTQELKIRKFVISCCVSSTPVCQRVDQR